MLNLLANFVGTPTTVQHERYLGDGPDGPTWAPAVARKARVERADKRIQTPEGRVVVLTGLVFLRAEDGEVSAQDRIDGRAVEQVTAPTWLSGEVMHYEAGVT